MSNPPGIEQKRPKSNPQKKKIQNPGFRPGDWICAVCQNFNFSFRKECNRCKVQTKAKNEQILKPSSLKLMTKQQKIELSNEKILSKKNSIDSNSTKSSLSTNLKMQFEAINRMCAQLNNEDYQEDDYKQYQKENSKEPTPSVSPLLRKIRSHNASFEDLDLIEIQEESFAVEVIEPQRINKRLDSEQEDTIFECFPVKIKKNQINVAQSSDLEKKTIKRRSIYMRRSYCCSSHESAQEGSKQSESGKSFKELQKSIERQMQMNLE